MTLFEFTDQKPPEVSVTNVIKNPADRSKTAGFLATDPERGVVYVSPRRKDDHYFRKYEGYAVSTSILDLLSHEGVDTVLILEDSQRLYEYDTAQFRDGVTVQHEGYDEQAVLPVKSAKRVWE